MKNIAGDALKKLCETADLFSAQNHKEEKAWEDLFEKYQRNDEDAASLSLDDIEYEYAESEESSINHSDTSLVLSDEECLDFNPNRTYSLSTHSSLSDKDLSWANRSLNSTPEFNHCEISIEKLSPEEFQTKQISNSKSRDLSNDSSQTDVLQPTNSSPSIKLYRNRPNSTMIKSSPNSPHPYPLLPRSRPGFTALQPYEVPPEVEKLIMLEFSEFVNTDSVHFLRVLLVARFHKSRMNTLTPLIEKSISMPFKLINDFICNSTPIKFNKIPPLKQAFLNATPRRSHGQRKLHSICGTDSSLLSTSTQWVSSNFENQSPNLFTAIDTFPTKRAINLLPTTLDESMKNHTSTFKEVLGMVKKNSGTKNAINLLPTKNAINLLPTKKAINLLPTKKAINLLPTVSPYNSSPKERSKISNVGCTLVGNRVFKPLRTDATMNSISIKRSSNSFTINHLHKRARLDYDFL